MTCINTTNMICIFPNSPENNSEVLIGYFLQKKRKYIAIHIFCSFESIVCQHILEYSYTIVQHKDSNWNCAGLEHLFSQFTEATQSSLIWIRVDQPTIIFCSWYFRYHSLLWLEFWAHFRISQCYNHILLHFCRRFQYVLAAATSIATKNNEETITYLNQGQSYEIKLKKLGDLTAYRGKILKVCATLSFYTDTVIKYSYSIFAFFTEHHQNLLPWASSAIHGTWTNAVVAKVTSWRKNRWAWCAIIVWSVSRGSTAQSQPIEYRGGVLGSHERSWCLH